MTVLPRRASELLSFLRVHLPLWAQDPPALGLQPGQLEAIIQAAEEAEAARGEALAARQTALAATKLMEARLRSAHAAASLGIASIKAHAALRPDPMEVYTRAQIPAPGAGSPIPIPGTPRVTAYTLDDTGALTLRWVCRHPRGSRNVSYTVERRTPGGPRVFLGSTGAKRFRDGTLPAGTPWAEYTITARRGAREGRACMKRINLGAVRAPGALPAAERAAA